jgi:LPS sulfotransferase NodH
MSLVSLRDDEPDWNPMPTPLCPDDTFGFTIAFTIRTGSNLLCNLLARNGAGFPTEYFQKPYGVTNKFWYDKLGVEPDDFSGFVTRLLAERRQNGMFGLKLAWFQKNEMLETIRRDLESDIAHVSDLFHRHQWIFMRRRDKFAQAVSAWTAQQTGLWTSHHRSDEPMPALEYDFRGLQTYFEEVLVEEYLWSLYFDRIGVQPIEVWYEDLIADRAGVVGGLVRELHDLAGAEPHAELDMETLLEQQRTELTVGFRDRFENDLHRIGA